MTNTVPIPTWCTCCKPSIVEELRAHAAAAFISEALAADARAMADEIESDPAASQEQQYRLNALRDRFVREGRAALARLDAAGGPGA